MSSDNDKTVETEQVINPKNSRFRATVRSSLVLMLCDLFQGPRQGATAADMTDASSPVAMGQRSVRS
ncbi:MULTISPECIES: hypothetical protein [unclassified Bradyrhizobium]|uniref:hypothetical protein n=1 Tax=Bradyrhizobium sp. USDA 4541 TaxID=2817704 RepID=UPI0020A5B729|nr:hypothetical protein [Bradyrhizobium sp. USDA 4541]MCP1850254.1 hypothetical protein [Bradyrhizobium sp. USDA 4541]